MLPLPIFSSVSCFFLIYSFLQLNSLMQWSWESGNDEGFFFSYRFAPNWVAFEIMLSLSSLITLSCFFLLACSFIPLLILLRWSGERDEIFFFSYPSALNGVQIRFMFRLTNCSTLLCLLPVLSFLPLISLFSFHSALFLTCLFVSPIYVPLLPLISSNLYNLTWSSSSYISYS